MCGRGELFALHRFSVVEIVTYVCGCLDLFSLFQSVRISASKFFQMRPFVLTVGLMPTSGLDLWVGLHGHFVASHREPNTATVTNCFVKLFKYDICVRTSPTKITPTAIGANPEQSPHSCMVATIPTLSGSYSPIHAWL